MSPVMSRAVKPDLMQLVKYQHSHHRLVPVSSRDGNDEYVDLFGSCPSRSTKNSESVCFIHTNILHGTCWIGVLQTRACLPQIQHSRSGTETKMSSRKSIRATSERDAMRQTSHHSTQHQHCITIFPYFL